MKRRMAFAPLLVVALLMFAFVSGCSPQAVEEKPAPAAPPAEAPAAPESTEVSITDVVGRTVTLEKPATKVVGTHNPTMNQLVILGGGGKYIAGFGNKNMSGSLYELVYPELKDDVPQIGKGKDLNMEAVLAVGADLAVLPERFAPDVDKFEDVDVPAAVVLPNNESFDTIRESLKRVATLVGADQKADEIITMFDAKIKAVSDIAAKAPEGPKALYTGGSSPLSVANGIMLQSIMMETVGATNVAKDVPGEGDFIEVTIEEIVGWNPEVIFIPAFADYTVDDLLNDPAWSTVKAVQDKRVYSCPSALEPWDYPTPSCALGLGWMTHTLNPDLYSIDQVMQDADDYYNLVYGQTFSAEQLGLAE